MLVLKFKLKKIIFYYLKSCKISNEINKNIKKFVLKTVGLILFQIHISTFIYLFISNNVTLHHARHPISKKYA